ncbi:NAD-dependent epimerase/dehydratase family protein [Litorivicinus sp.]|nr:NAD-dependent epimerase/dehydratase family protein [Litorivicinus sp.]MDC1239974.1 NAD-dependent epimerase/dehydratase family protein [Litorivicinus sp.]
MQWLITGGCGFIGTALIKYLMLSANPPRIRIVDNLSVGTRSDLARVTEFSESRSNDCSWDKAVTLVVADIKDAQVSNELALGADIIFHLAANTGVGPSVEEPRFDMLTNVIGVFNYLDAARVNKVPRFVFASSGAPVGEVDPPIHEEIPPKPVSPYGASKLAGEGYCSAYYRTFGVETVTLRFGNVYGPGSSHKDSVVAKFIKKALAGESLEIFGDGSQTRDFIFIDDLILALIRSASASEVGGEIFQIATSRETSIQEMVVELAKVLNDRGVTEFDIIHGSERLGDVARNFSDTTKAKERLGWQASFDLRVGLGKTVDYFLSEQNV